MGIQERLAAMKEKQEAGDSRRAEEATEAKAEAAKAEKRGELQTEREAVMTELSGAEAEANAADDAIAEANEFAESMGEILDPEAAVEIEAIKVEADEAKQKYEDLKAEVARIDAQLEGLEEGGDGGTVETAEETAEESEVVSEQVQKLRDVAALRPDARKIIKEKVMAAKEMDVPELKTSFEQSSEEYSDLYEANGEDVEGRRDQALFVLAEALGVPEDQLQEIKESPRLKLPNYTQAPFKIAALGSEKGQQLVSELLPLYQANLEQAAGMEEAYLQAAVARDDLKRQKIGGSDQRDKSIEDIYNKQRNLILTPFMGSLQKAAESGFDQQVLAQEKFGDDYDRFAKDGIFAMSILENALEAGAGDFVQEQGDDIKKAHKDPKFKRDKKRIERLAEKAGVSLE